MFLKRSVAGLAVHPSMFACFLLLHDICVAIFTGFMACIIGRTRHDLLQCVSAVMPVLPKAFWDEIGSER